MAAEGKRAGPGGRNQLWLTHIKKLDENAGELYNAVVGAPGMAIARANREAEARIELAGRVEIADGVNDMVKTVGHPSP